MDCAALAEVAPELVLEVLTGRERAAALAHLETCSPCRRLVSTMAADADVLLLLAPPAKPPLGFDDRVVELVAAQRELTAETEHTVAPADPAAPASRAATASPAATATQTATQTTATTAPAPPVRGRPPSRPRTGTLASVALAACAAVVAVVVGLGVPTRPAVATADMRANDGELVGQVFVQSEEPAALFLTLPGWEERIQRYDGADRTYAVRIERAGRPPHLVPFDLDGNPTWGTMLSVDPDAITAVAVVDSRGNVWCKAVV